MDAKKVIAEKDLQIGRQAIYERYKLSKEQETRYNEQFTSARDVSNVTKASEGLKYCVNSCKDIQSKGELLEGYIAHVIEANSKNGKMNAKAAANLTAVVSATFQELFPNRNKEAKDFARVVVNEAVKSKGNTVEHKSVLQKIKAKIVLQFSKWTTEKSVSNKHFVKAMISNFKGKAKPERNRPPAKPLSKGQGRG